MKDMWRAIQNIAGNKNRSTAVMCSCWMSFVPLDKDSAVKFIPHCLHSLPE